MVEVDNQSLNHNKFRQSIRGSGLGYCARKLAYASGVNDTDNVITINSSNEQEDGVDNGEKIRTDNNGDNSTTLPINISVSTNFPNPRFADGNYHEFDIKRRMLEVGAEFIIGTWHVAQVKIPLLDDYNVSGHLDGVVNIPEDFSLLKVPGGVYILEAKSMSTGMFWKFVKGGLREGFPYYFDQVQGYLHSKAERITTLNDEPLAPMYHSLPEEKSNTPLAHNIPLRILLVAKNKETGALKHEIITPDESHWAGLVGRWREADERVREGRLPDRLYESPEQGYECRECDFRRLCWDGVTETDTNTYITPISPTTSTEELVEAAKVYRVGRNLEDIADKMKEWGRARLELAEPGKAEVEGVKINAYTTKHTSWNYKELEKLLTPQQLDMVRVVKSGVVQNMKVKKMDREELMAMLGEVDMKMVGSGEVIDG